MINLEPGCIVLYQGQEVRYRKTNEAGFAQLELLNGTKLPGTPRPEKLIFVRGPRKSVLDIISEQEKPLDITPPPPARNMWGFNANQEQQEAIDTIMDFLSDNENVVHSLVGAAGTGKTSTLKALFTRIVREMPHIDVQVAAPTHKAVQQVQRLTSKEATTLQAMLGLRPDMNIELFSKRDLQFAKTGDEKMDHGGLLVVDEASMINDELYEAIYESAHRKRKKVLFVGDRLQLKPVKNKNNQESLVFRDPSRTSELLTVMRQDKESPLLETLDIMRDFIDSDINALPNPATKLTAQGEGIEFIFEPTGFLDRLKAEFQSPEFDRDKDGIKVLAYRNDTVAQYNETIRGMLGYSGPPAVGEILMAYDNVSMGTSNDLKIVNSNTYEVFHVGTLTTRHINGVPINGRMVTVKDANNFGASSHSIFLMSPDENEEDMKARLAESIHMLTTAIRASGNRRRWATEFYPLMASFSTMEEMKHGPYFVKGKTVDFGYAHTVHKSQGSTYRKVFVDGHDIDSVDIPQNDKNRLKYVALSRPTSNAVMFLQ